MNGAEVVDGGGGAVLETTVTDADLHRAHESAEPPPPQSEPAVSEQIMAAYNTAKSAGEAQNARSRRIADELRRQRDGEAADVPAAVPAAGGQTAITDFGGVSE